MSLAELGMVVNSNFAKPLNDLSRGCKSEDIVAAVAITALQTQL